MAKKFNPVSIEALIQGHPLLMGALVVGQGRFQAALLLEPQPDTYRASLVEEVWPLVKQANLLVSGHGQLARTKVEVTNAGKPFQRAGKGTVVRKLTERSYELEITALYENDSSIGKEDSQVLRASFELEAIKQLVHSSITSSLSEVEFTDRNDLFVLRLDSLKTVTIAGMLKAELLVHRKKSELSWLSDRLLYSNPTVDQLSAAIYNFLNLGVIPGVDNNNRSHIRRAKIAALVEKFTQNLPQRSLQPYSQSRAAGIV